MEYLCKCNNCESVFIDENPQINAKKHDVSLLQMEILPMELLQDEFETYFGCGNCQTDQYLKDIL